jgi:hypothetical protein
LFNLNSFIKEIIKIGTDAGTIRQVPTEKGNVKIIDLKKIT